MSSAAVAPETLPALTLQDLAQLSFSELSELYREGAEPRLSDLDGEPRCRMLAVAGPLGRGRTLRRVARLAAHARFPWRGKAFASTGERGTGINRILLGGGPVRRWYPFTTCLEPSALDGEPCVHLDYRLPENPWFIRMIRDELREVSPGLFLGPALVRLRGGYSLGLWFAVDHSA